MASSGLYQLIVYQYDVMARHIVSAIASIKDAIIVQKQLLHPTSVGGLNGSMQHLLAGFF